MLNEMGMNVHIFDDNFLGDVSETTKLNHLFGRQTSDLSFDFERNLPL